MKVRVKFFAILRERAGTAEVVKEVVDGSTVADLWRELQNLEISIAPFEREREPAATLRKRSGRAKAAGRTRREKKRASAKTSQARNALRM